MTKTQEIVPIVSESTIAISENLKAIDAITFFKNVSYNILDNFHLYLKIELKKKLIVNNMF